MNFEKLESILEDIKYLNPTQNERYLRQIRKFEDRFDNDMDLFEQATKLYFGPIQGSFIIALMIKYMPASAFKPTEPRRCKNCQSII